MKNTKKINSFVKYLRLKERSNQTIDSYKSVLNRLFLSVDEYAERIRTVQIEDYLLTIDNANTRNQALGCIKSFFYFIKRPQLVKDIPYADKPMYLPNIISKEEYQIGFSKISNSKHRLIAAFLFSHGMRIGEVQNITIGWFGSQVIKKVKHYTLNITGKGAKDRLIVLSSRTINLLSIYSKDYDIDLHNRNQILFKGQFGGLYSQTSIRNIIIKYFGTNPHALRHSFATEMVNQEKNLAKIRDQLGHASTKTTEIYTHVSIQSKIGMSA